MITFLAILNVALFIVIAFFVIPWAAGQRSIMSKNLHRENKILLMFNVCTSLSANMLHNADNGEDLYHYYQEMLDENIKRRDQVESIPYVEAAEIAVLRKILGKYSEAPDDRTFTNQLTIEGL